MKQLFPRRLSGVIVAAVFSVGWLLLERGDSDKHKNKFVEKHVVQPLKNPRQPTRQPCQLDSLVFSDVNETALQEQPEIMKRFNVVNSSLSCSIEVRPVPEAGSQYSMMVVWLEFDISECPPWYSGSTFQVVSSTANTKFKGWVEPRSKRRSGCAIYKSQVPIVMDQQKNASEENIAVIDLHWTSNRSSYSNRLSDILWAAEAYKNGKKPNLEHDIGYDRMDYLQPHYEPVQGFPLSLKVKLPENLPQLVSPTDHDRVPDCSQVPIVEWKPVGVADTDKRKGGVYSSAWCWFKDFTKDELNHELKGIRTKYLLDSHGQREASVWSSMICPETNGNVFYGNKYVCPNTTDQTFVMAWRFFRGILHPPTFNRDMDGLSWLIRKGDPAACSKALSYGFYNVTIVGIPSWVYIYDSDEGMMDLADGIQSMVETCKAQLSNHVVLIQTSYSTDSTNKKSSIESNWRGIQNYRIEAFSKVLEEKLGGLVDGIIPMFDMTLAQNILVGTDDGTHQKDYRKPAQVHASAVISALRVRRQTQGDQFLRPSGLEDARWFDGVQLE